MKKYDLGISVVMTAFAGWIFYATKDFSAYYRGTPGSGFWPRVLAVALIVLSVGLAASTLLKKSDTKEREKAVIAFSSPGMKRVYWMLAVMLATAFSINYLGFVVTSLWLIPAIMLIMGEKRALRLVIGSVAITAAVYVIFTYLLKMSLPEPFFM